MGFFENLKNGLKKTKDAVVAQVKMAINSFVEIDDEFFETIEETLIKADMGVSTSSKICDMLRKKVKQTGETDTKNIMKLLQEVIVELLGPYAELDLSTKPAIILVIGVNGVGKTTTIGKMAWDLKKRGKKVILGAADTFRAAAIEQLEEWATRANVDIIKHKEGADPAAVVFDTIKAGKARGADVIICDTAGRLHNKKHLMDELSKISRIISKEMPDSASEVLLVLDATTGQNGISQAKSFMEVTNLTGIVLTKLDGTAKGGVVISIKDELSLPVKYIGVGEKIDDLQPFVPSEFATALFE